MTKNEAFELFGGARKLAEALGLSVQAVHQWEDDSIPELRVYQIKEILASKAAK